ncbi:MAG: hypothetical protein ACRDP4_01070, partial [Nocardioidaceae bacterium]
GEDGVHLSWRAGDASTTSYAVYRLQRDDHGKVKGSDCRLADATHLLATMRTTGAFQHFVDTTAEPGVRYTYVITGLDRTWNESPTTQRDVIG